MFEIPGGWLGDWMGPRTVLMRFVIWWSFFTAATGWMFSYSSMLVTRFLFGAGEAGCFPNITKAFSTWLPLEERVRAQGILWMAARWGGAFTPPLVNWIFKIMDWRTAFLTFGVGGTVWAYFFYRWFRDNPQEHPEVNAAERELIAQTAHPASGHGDVPWGQPTRPRGVLRARQVPGLPVWGKQTRSGCSKGGCRRHWPHHGRWRVLTSGPDPAW